MNINGYPVKGFRSPDSKALWIRDHSDILRGGKYVIDDVKSAVQCFADAQAANGRIYDFVTTYPMAPGGAGENWETWVRIPVEADVEYRFVKAGYLAWQASGDDEWMLQLLPAFERALLYVLKSPLRWDQERQLIKRPFTIDTWDFDYTAGRCASLNFQIDDATFWGIMHGDNSGFYEALNLIGQMFKVAGQFQKAARCRHLAIEIQDRANALLYNGAFYEHFHKLSKINMNGFDDSRQLSLSNPMAINRGMATPDIARSILNEYQARKAQTEAFAEWFSIDPPFPADFFGEEKLAEGYYCNGGIMPLVGGELAHAAFEYGMEQYGYAILDQYRSMIEEKKASYLWYFPDGTPASVEHSTSPEASSTDAWGSSAMLYALVEGLCGVKDEDNSFGKVRCAPRWLSAGESEARVELAYPASGASFRYEYDHDASAKAIHVRLLAAESEVTLQLLLPEGAQFTAIHWGGAEKTPGIRTIEQSLYVEVEGEVSGEAEVTAYYAL